VEAAVMAKSDMDRMLEEVRGVVARYVHLPEKDVYEVLVAEAEGWEMRLRELEDEQNETE
jgi:hypothetical protein